MDAGTTAARIRSVGQQRRRNEMATDRRADVTWQGSLMEGSGTIRSTTSGKLGEQKVSWPNRAEDSPDATSPEELIAAAHAACYAMALSHALAQGGNAPDELQTSATVTFQPGEGITKIALTVEGRVPGVDEEAFRKAAEDAKQNCPVSKALSGVPEVTLDARLAS
jgi:osmotically inducible protein OsmC